LSCADSYRKGEAMLGAFLAGLVLGAFVLAVFVVVVVNARQTPLPPGPTYEPPPTSIVKGGDA
jgi:hypothetical protein